MPLDVVEVAKVCSLLTIECSDARALTRTQSHTGLEMATVFAAMLEDFSLTDKVRC